MNILINILGSGKIVTASYSRQVRTSGRETRQDVGLINVGYNSQHNCLLYKKSYQVEPTFSIERCSSLYTLCLAYIVL